MSAPDAEPALRGRSAVRGPAPLSGSDPLGGSAGVRAPATLTRGQEAYERARRRLVWQARMPDRYPSEIVVVSSAAEVAAAIRWAAAHGRQVSVVSSGHSYCASGVQHDRVLLDLTGLQQVDIASEAARAHVGVGVTNGRLDAMLEPLGLAFPIGHSPSVALGGYLLGGGLGWNSEQWGQAACFSVLGADVVLSNGERVQVSESQEPDLFWALRGAGPLFPGVVTRYELGLAPRPASIAQASCSYSLEMTSEIARWVTAFLPDKALNVELSASFESRQSSAGAAVGAITLTAVSFGDAHSDAMGQLARLTSSWPRTGRLCAPTLERTSFAALLAQNDVAAHRHAVETAWTDEIEVALTTIATHFCASPSRESSLHVSFRTDPGLQRDGAYSMSARALVFSATVWQDADDDARQLAWGEAVTAALTPITVGRYVNETDYVDHPERIRASFSPAALERIGRIRARYDPEGIFACADALA